MHKILRKFVPRVTIPLRRFGEVKRSDSEITVEAILKEYEMEKLMPYKEMPITPKDFELLKLTKESSVRQVYTSWVHHSKLLKVPGLEDAENKQKFIDVAYHKLIMAKIKDAKNLSSIEKRGRN
jgi:hypothetical protein